MWDSEDENWRFRVDGASRTESLDEECLARSSTRVINTKNLLHRYKLAKQFCESASCYHFADLRNMTSRLMRFLWGRRSCDSTHRLRNIAGTSLADASICIYIYIQRYNLWHAMQVTCLLLLSTIVCGFVVELDPLLDKIKPIRSLSKSMTGFICPPFLNNVKKRTTDNMIFEPMPQF